MKEIRINPWIQERALAGRPWADMGRLWTNVQQWLEAVTRTLERERSQRKEQQ